MAIFGLVSNVASAISYLIFAKAVAPDVLLFIVTAVTCIFPLMNGMNDYYGSLSKSALRGLAFASSLIQTATSASISAFIYVPKLLAKLSSSGAGRVLVGLCCNGESIEMDAVSREGITELGKKLGDIHPELFKNEPFIGDTIKLNCFADAIAVRNTLKLYDEDIGIAFASASIK